MKIRSGHLVVAVLAVLGGFVVFAVAYSGMRPATDSGAADSAYILPPQEVPAETASLPPASEGPEDMPVMELETHEFDLGVIPNDKPGTKDLMIYNRGKAPLIINQIKSSCACTYTKTDETRPVIPPGGSLAVHVYVTPFRVPGFFSKKHLTIFSNDFSQSRVEVAVTAQVDPEFTLEPEDLDFGEVAKGTTPEKTVLLRQTREKPVELKAVRLSAGKSGEEEEEEEEEVDPDAVKDTDAEPPGMQQNGELMLSFEKRPEAEWQSPDKAEYLIHVQLQPLLPPGNFQRRFIIDTNVERLSRIGGMRYAVHGEIKAFYTITPAWPHWLGLRAEASDPGHTKGSVVISSDRPVEITDIEADTSKFTTDVRYDSGDNGFTVFLDISVLPEVPPGSLKEDVYYTIRSEGTAYREHTMVRAAVFALLPPQ